MKHLLTIMASCLIFLGLCLNGSAFAFTMPADTAIVGFEELVNSAVQDGYADIDCWNNFSINERDSVPSLSGYSTVMSGDKVALNYGARTSSFEDSDNFRFLGGDFAAAWREDLCLNIWGYDDGEEIFNKTYTLNYNEITKIIIEDFWGDKICMDSFGGTRVPTLDCYGEGEHFAADNMLFSRAAPGNSPINPSATPEPATFLLFGFGLLGLTGVSREKI